MAIKNKLLLTSAVTLATSLAALPAQAGVKLKDEKSGIVVDLGGRLQYQTIFNDSDFRDGSGNKNRVEYKVRRARIRLGIDPHPWWKMFLQTEFQNEAGASSGGDARVIDANITFKPNNWFQLVGGERMAPVSRQNLTSSGGLMAIDRPGTTNYVLTWGLAGRSRFNNSNISGTKAGNFGDVSVRDLGITLFGAGSFSDELHLKYYAGVSDGSVEATDDDERYSFRAQLNYGDAEPGYFGLSTYLGKKQTLALGFGYDRQNAFTSENVGTADAPVAGSDVDYTFWTVDAFADWPVGPGFVTGEAAYNKLDVDGGENALIGGTGNAADNSQGKGGYFQTGYFINNWQPWAAFEQWDSDGNDDAGDWDAYRVGVSYFFKGHNANVKLGFERTNNDGPGEDDFNTFVLGAYITF